MIFYTVYTLSVDISSKYYYYYKLTIYILEVSVVSEFLIAVVCFSFIYIITTTTINYKNQPFLTIIHYSIEGKNISMWMVVSE